MLLTLPADFTKNPKNAAIVKAFKDKGRDPGGAFQMTSFAAMQAIVAGIKGVGADDPVKVAAYLHSHSVETPIGDLSWNKQGDLKRFKFAVFTWQKDGRKTVDRKSLREEKRVTERI